MSEHNSHSSDEESEQQHPEEVKEDPFQVKLIDIQKSIKKK